MRITEFPSPNHGGRRAGRTPDILLLHYTGMQHAAEALDWLCAEESGVSCHYLVDEAGDVFRLVGEHRRAWHAGVSSWAGESDVNSRSIGIEVQNPGHDRGYPDFADVQMSAVEELCLDIVSRHAIPPRRVLAHSDVAPGRKIDPGEKFDWSRLHRAGIGHWVKPVAPGDDAGLRRGDRGTTVRDLQSALAAYGYGVEVTGNYDDVTHCVVAAFQLHFRQERIDGIADLSTLRTLDRLVSAGAAGF